MSDPTPNATRRGWLLWALVGVCHAGVAALLGVPGIRLLLAPLKPTPAERGRWDLGLAEDVALPGPTRVELVVETEAGYVVTRRRVVLYVVETDGQLVALRPECTHLGCNVDWRGEGFDCPCHGGRFDRIGAPTAGPPEAPLERLPIVREDGRLWAELG